MHTCPQCEDTVLALLGAIEKMRALTEEESVFLERIIRRQNERQRHCGITPRTYVTWTADMDRKLMRAITPTQKRDFSERHGVSMRAIKDRLRRLKRADANRVERV